MTFSPLERNILGCNTISMTAWPLPYIYISKKGKLIIDFQLRVCSFIKQRFANYVFKQTISFLTVRYARKKVPRTTNSDIFSEIALTIRLITFLFDFFQGTKFVE